MSSTQQLLLGEGAGGGPANYIEDVFSTFLYTGTGASRTIVNGIDLSTKGGLIWFKARSAAYDNYLFNTINGLRLGMVSNSATYPGLYPADGLTAYNTNGFSLGADTSYVSLNDSGTNFVSWTFREQPKFFDVVTYTGDGVGGRTVAHNLGAVPGCILVKRTDATFDWRVYHRSTDATNYLVLNTTAGKVTSASMWENTEPTSTEFTVGANNGVNASGGTYVAYLFAHDAGGFGLAGTDNVISCGSFTTDGIGIANVTLGYEPQWLMVKRSNSTSNWLMKDIMRGGLTATVSGQTAATLAANTANAESTNANTNGFNATATGFYSNGNETSGTSTYIYVAIRRGPMKVPTDATKVFAPNTYAGGTVGRSFSFGFIPDVLLTMRRNITNFDVIQSRLIGINYLQTNDAGAEVAGTIGMPAWDAPTTTLSLTDVGTPSRWNISGSNYVNEGFVRAPSFMDVVCYTGTGSNTTFSHNLGVAPEWMMVKSRSNAGTVWTVWTTYMASLNAASGIYLNSDGERFTNASYFNSTAPTSAVFTVGTDSETNASASTYVNYLFATCAGVSKVGNFTGTAALQTIDCGFTSGARFVLIKRISSGGGNWFVWDSARGISSSDDPYLILNNTPAEVTNTNYVDTTSVGFQVTAAASTTVNASGGLYIFLAIA